MGFKWSEEGLNYLVVKGVLVQCESVGRDEFELDDGVGLERGLRYAVVGCGVVGCGMVPIEVRYVSGGVVRV